MDVLRVVSAVEHPESDSPSGLGAGPPPWRAELSLRYARDVLGCTRLVHTLHQGPLRVQRPLYPEGPELAHTLLLHPPGGIAGGDVLELDIELASNAQVLCTTPGASKWYHGERGRARQTVRLRVASGACLEWLPQEAIVFDGANAEQELLIELEPQASLFAWDLVQFGRLSAGELWRRGHWCQRVILRRAGRACLREVVSLAADDRLRSSPLGMAGYPCMASAWVCAPHLGPDMEPLLDALRACAAKHDLTCGISWLPAPTELLLIRALGDSSAALRSLLEDLWNVLRAQLSGRQPQRPRIWDT